jgi:hypothetical protein
MWQTAAENNKRSLYFAYLLGALPLGKKSQQFFILEHIKVTGRRCKQKIKRILGEKIRFLN